MQEPLDRVQITQLVVEAQIVRDWLFVRDFCDQVYGANRANSATLETHGEYNDEGGTDYSVESVTARDSEGRVLEYDLALPFWQNILVGRKRYSDDDQEFAEDAIRDWYRNADEPETHQWLTWEELPCDIHNGGTHHYDLAKPPGMSFIVIAR